MSNALIGFTGLVGGSLMRQAHFDDLYNSRNIESIGGKSYQLLVCAGLPAQKWLANREPVPDRQNVQRLMCALARVQAQQVILVSTVDVFPVPIGVDEETPIDRATQHAYGKHRYLLETFVQSRFASVVVRLPGLFGSGLKKNVLYDFLHQNDVAKIHARSVFQFYALDWLWRDLEIARSHKVGLIHFATQPLTVREIAAQAFDWEFNQEPPSASARYDFRSRYASHYGGSNGYLYSRTQVLDALREFVQAEKRKQDAANTCGQAA